LAERHFETEAIHAGQEPDPTTGAVIVPIYATATYAQDAPGDHKGFEYSRTDNPTRHALEQVLATLSGAGGGGAIAAASGLAATTLVGYLLEPGDHVVIPNDAYGGTHRFFTQVAGRQQGIEWSVADLTHVDGLERAMRPETKLVWVETPTNPFLRIVDIAAVVATAHDGGALVCVDNTFATPYLQRPLELGADLELHSTTKYMGGHSDLIGGAVITSDVELTERLHFLQNALGPVPGPFDAYLVLRGLKTLALRMEKHSANAVTIAEFLAGDDRVAEVFYPGLESHPGHALAARQMAAFGGMVTFRSAMGADGANKVASSTELFVLAESLGAVESLIEVPAIMTHASVAGTELEVPPDVVRLSVGIEHVDDLIADLDQAL